MNRIRLRRAAAGAVLATALVSSVFVTTAVAQGPDDSRTSVSARHHEAGDDHGRHGGRQHRGRHHEAGDDHGRGGRHHEAGDDHGGR